METPRMTDSGTVIYPHRCERCGKDWESQHEYPSRCKFCKSNSFDVPIGGYIGRRGTVHAKSEGGIPHSNKER